MQRPTLLLLLAGGFALGCASSDVDLATDRAGDGLSDADESAMGTDPSVADSDGDGFDDGEEAAAGTDPLDPDDYEGAEEEVVERWPTAPCDPEPEALGQNQVGQIAHNVEGTDQFGDPIALYDYCEKTVLMLGGGFG